MRTFREKMRTIDTCYFTCVAAIHWYAHCSADQRNDYQQPKSTGDERSNNSALQRPSRCNLCLRPCQPEDQESELCCIARVLQSVRRQHRGLSRSVGGAGTAY